MNNSMCIASVESMRDDFYHVLQLETSDPDNFFNPGTSFSRSRLLSREDIVSIPFRMEKESVSSTLGILFGDSLPSLSASALTLARSKVRSTLYETTFNRLNEMHSHMDKDCFKGHRLIAVDGSEIKSCLTQDNAITLGGSKKGGKRSYYHLNASYDVLNHVFTDAVIQPGSVKNEDRALLEMAQRNPDPDTIYICDRGYECLMTFHRLNAMGKNFVIRIKDEDSAISLLKHYPTPEAEEYDIPFKVTLTCKNNKQTKEHWDTYKYISSYKYLEEFSDGTAYIPLSVRVVCFKACSTNGQESVITVCTNLPDSQFSTDDIKEIYRLRWQIEVNFRNLKRVLDLEWLHGRKQELVLSEIYAKMTLCNLAGRIKKLVERSDQFQRQARKRIRKRSNRKSANRKSGSDKNQETPADANRGSSADPYKADWSFIILQTRHWLLGKMTSQTFWGWIVNKVQIVRPGRADRRKASKRTKNNPGIIKSIPEACLPETKIS